MYHFSSSFSKNRDTCCLQWFAPSGSIFILYYSHLLPLFDKIFSADVSHDSCSQSVTHHIDHGPESIPGWQGQKSFSVDKTLGKGITYIRYWNLNGADRCYRVHTMTSAISLTLPHPLWYSNPPRAPVVLLLAPEVPLWLWAQGPAAAPPSPASPAEPPFLCTARPMWVPEVYLWVIQSL